MNSSKCLLAVIPARLGSRRVPRKNIRELLGRPAISYTIAAALESDLFDRVVVSTDAEEIATVARSHGAEVPFLRGAALADDETHVSAVTADALDRIDPECQVTAVAQLLPNCPLRTADDVRASYARFAESGADAQLSVTHFGWQNPWWASRLSPAGTLEPLFPEAMTQRSQDLAELFCPTGAVWWARAAVVREKRTFHVAGRTGWVMPWHRAVDIDTEEDWQMAEQLLQLGNMTGIADAR
ncbi:MAG TPA: acylneuraminate cytidylyltransferase family protein [Gemmatimonadales bacterium]|jgi:N-acylneuraminate cytidylyltransferase|nr:acylneuraminate cytidylyltransferase family protein [Gemmatimonadales bacterium]